MQAEQYDRAEIEYLTALKLAPLDPTAVARLGSFINSGASRRLRIFSCRTHPTARRTAQARDLIIDRRPKMRARSDARPENSRGMRRLCCCFLILRRRPGRKSNSPAG